MSSLTLRESGAPGVALGSEGPWRTCRSSGRGTTVEKEVKERVRTRLSRSRTLRHRKAPGKELLVTRTDSVSHSHPSTFRRTNLMCVGEGVCRTLSQGCTGWITGERLRDTEGLRGWGRSIFSTVNALPTAHGPRCDSSGHRLSRLGGVSEPVSDHSGDGQGVYPFDSESFQ